MGKNEDLSSVYNSGKGISALFNKMSDNLKVEAGSIFGYLKTSGVESEDIITNIDFTWNYILIDGEYYLINVSSGIGFFQLKGFTRTYIDFFSALIKNFSFVNIFLKIINGNYYLIHYH